MHFLFALISIVGTWESLFHTPTSGDVRRVMEITKAASGYNVVIHSIDESDVPITTRNVTINGRAVTFKFDMNSDPWGDYHRVWKATLSADGKALFGPWSGYDPKHAIPTSYHRVAHTSWPVMVPKSSMVPVEPDVNIEALDWGGTGRPVVLIAGSGDTAHSFVKLAPLLVAKYHVYSVTRRGYGLSSKPKMIPANYTSDRLGDDVIAVLDALNIQKPVLIGHSLGGEELSDIAMRYPHRAAGLVYLEAATWPAYDSGVGNMKPDKSYDPISNAIIGGVQSLKGPIDDPILAIFAVPQLGASPKDDAEESAQIKAFAKAYPQATVQIIPHAGHYLHISHTAQVLKSINAFIAKLPTP